MKTIDWTWLFGRAVSLLLLIASQATAADSHLVSTHNKDSFRYSDGNSYVGDLDERQFRHGKGIFTFANGRKYIGEFRDNMRHGIGVFTNTQGGIYAGEWKNDKPNGTGYDTVSGRERVGLFRDGKFIGLTQSELREKYDTAISQYGDSGDRHFIAMQELANLGSIDGHLALAHIYNFGDGNVEPDVEKAEYHYLIAARANSGYAQFELARFYAGERNGKALGIANRYLLAAYFFKLAKQNDFWPSFFYSYEETLAAITLDGSAPSEGEPEAIILPKCDRLALSNAEFEDCNVQREEELNSMSRRLHNAAEIRDAANDPERIEMEKLKKALGWSTPGDAEEEMWFFPKINE